MAFDRSIPLALAFPIVALIPADADAATGLTAGAPCYNPTGEAGEAGGDAGGDIYYCNAQSLDGLTSLHPDEIPIDGVLVLQAAYRGAWDAGIVARAVVTVTQGDVAVAGALELTPAPGYLIWRPTESWTPATYHFAATVTNADDPGTCSEDFVAESDFTVDPEPSSKLEASLLSGTEELLTTPVLGLGTIACCPGFAPTLYLDQCGGGESLQFDPEQCTPLVAEGTLFAHLNASNAVSDATAFQVYYELTVDGASFASNAIPEFLVTTQKSFCATVTAHLYAGGESITGPMACFGTSHAAELGTIDLVPPESFTCSLRQCELDSNTWDLEACTPLDPNNPNEPAEDDTKSGCGCAADPTPPVTALALLGLAGLLLRRRRR